MRFILPFFVLACWGVQPAQAERYIVGLRSPAVSASQVQFSGIPKLESLNSSRAVVVDVAGASKATLLKKLQSDPRVAYVELDRPIQSAATPPVNDPLLSQQWSLGAVSVFDAWKSGWPQVAGAAPVVAVLDSGVDLTHQDLVGAAWTNQDEVPDNGIDDDANGYIDDINGWNWSEGNNTISDPTGHGTRVAGIIAARSNNSLGIAGVAPQAKIMSLRILADNGNTLTGTVSDAIQAIDYASDNGAKIINNSWGHYMSSSAALNAAIERAKADGVLVVNAAGNGNSEGVGLNIDPVADPKANPSPNPYYPASYGAENSLAVAALDKDNQITAWSNYGPRSVQLGAPGDLILSTVPGDDYQEEQGTSMAAPMVSGAAAWMWGIRPTASYKTVRRALADFGLPQKNLSGKTTGGKRLDVLNSWKWFQTAPVVPRNLIPPSVDTVGADQVQCFPNSWDAGTGTNYKYSWWEQGGSDGSPTYTQVVAPSSRSVLLMAGKYWGKKLRCKAQAYNSAGAAQPILSSNYKRLETPFPVNTTLPAVSGVIGVGRALQCSTGRWDYMGSGGSYAYSWKLNGNLLEDTDNSYTVEKSDLGKTITCTVVATNSSLGEGGDYQSTSAQSKDFKLTIAPDASSPSPPLVLGIPSYTNKQSQAFELRGERLALFRCSLDGAAETSCPAAFSGLVSGEHTLEVTQTDLAGNKSAAASKTWEVDLTPPATPTVLGESLKKINDGSSAITNLSKVTLLFESNEPDARFQCKLQTEKNFSACTSPRVLMKLRAGAYAIQVKQQDRAGNWGPATNYAWVVDLAVPATPSITTRPPAASLDHEGDITFSGEANASFVCTLDGVSAPCASPFAYADLDTGDHTFSVVQKDLAGNVSPANSFSWSIVEPDNTPPDPPVISGVPVTGYTNQNKFSISWTGESGGSYQCSVDSVEDNYKACSSPIAFSYTQSGPHTLKVRQTDNFGNVGEPAQAQWSSDFVLPSVSSWTLPGTFTKENSMTYTANFSEPVKELVDADLSLSGTATGCLATTDAPNDGSFFSSAQITVSGCSTGTVLLSISASTLRDRAGNLGPASKAASSTVTIDRTAPSVVSWSSPATPNRSASLTFSVRFQEPIENLSSDDFSNTGTAEDCVFNPSSASGTLISVVASGCGEGTVVPTLAANAVQDRASNIGPAQSSSAAAVLVDRTKPGAEWTLVPTTPTAATALTYRVQFDETVTGFAVSDLSNVGTATGCSFSASSTATPMLYQVTVQNCSSGTVVLRLAAGAVYDQAGNTGPAAFANAEEVLIDRSKPNASWTSIPATPTSDATLTYTLAFTKAVSGLESSDFAVAGSATGCVVDVQPGDNNEYQVTVDECSAGTVILSLAKDAVQDEAGNLGPTIKKDTSTVLIDRGAPEVQSFTTAANSPTNSAELTYTLQLSESVSGISEDDFSVAGTATGWSVSEVSGSGSSYTIKLSSDTPSDGTVYPVLAAESIQDLAGNWGPATDENGEEVQTDQTAPVADSFLSEEVSPSNAKSIQYNLHFSEEISGLAANDFVVRGTSSGWSVQSVSGSDDTYTVTIAAATPTDGTVYPELQSASVADLAGNTGPADALGADAIDIDLSAPQVAAFTTAESSPSSSSSFDYTLQFSEPVSDLDPSDFQILGTATGWEIADVVGGGDTYTVTLSAVSPTDGTVYPRLQSSSVSDLAGNLGPISSADGPAINNDQTNPSVVSFDTAAASPSDAASLSYTLVMSESIGSLSADSFSVGGTATGWTVDSVTGSGTTYTVVLNQGAEHGDGTIYPVLPAGAIQDSVGNTGPAEDVNGEEVEIDQSGPSINNWSVLPSTPTNESTLGYALQFSDQVSSLQSSDFQNDGTATGCVFTPSASQGTDINIAATGCSEGTVILTLKADSVLDALGNAGPSADDPQRSAQAIIIDRSASQPVLYDAPDTWTNNTTATIAWTGEEDAVYECSTDNGSSYDSCVSPFQADGLADGAYSFRVRQSDLAGNTSASASTSWNVDTVAPAAPVFQTKPRSYIVPTASANLTWSGEAYATYQCSTNDSNWNDCNGSGNTSTSKTIDSSTETSYSLAIKQIDRAGNESEIAEASWNAKRVPTLAWDETNAMNTIYQNTGQSQANGATVNAPNSMSSATNGVAVAYSLGGGQSSGEECSEDGGITWVNCATRTFARGGFNFTLNTTPSGDCANWKDQLRVRAWNETTQANTDIYAGGYTTPITLNVHRKCPALAVTVAAPADSYETSGAVYGLQITSSQTGWATGISCVWNILGSSQTTSCPLAKTSNPLNGLPWYESGNVDVSTCTGCWNGTNKSSTLTMLASTADGLTSSSATATRVRRTNGYALSQAVTVDGTNTTGWTARTCLSGATSQVADSNSTGAAFSAQPSAAPTELRVTNSTCSGTAYYGIATAAPIYNYGDDIQFTARLTGATGTPQIQPRIRTFVGGGTADTIMANTVLSSTSNKTCRIYMGNSVIGSSIYLQISGRGSTALGAYGGYFDNFSSTAAVGSSTNGGSCA